MDQVRRDVGRIEQQKRAEPILSTPKAETEVLKIVEHDPRDVLSYNDVEILRTLSEGGFVYGNLVAICDSTGLTRDFVSQRLTVMKAMGVIETRINDKNVLHWFVSARGKAVLGDILGGQEQKSA
jgi:DNA-binding transcriptional ArsR family regulator